MQVFEIKQAKCERSSVQFKCVKNVQCSFKKLERVNAIIQVQAKSVVHYKTASFKKFKSFLKFLWRLNWVNNHFDTTSNLLESFFFNIKLFAILLSYDSLAKTTTLVSERQSSVFQVPNSFLNKLAC